jgi:hypothetical protein
MKMPEEEIRYCYSCQKNTEVEWQRFSDLEYGDGHCLDVEISFCSTCGDIFEVEQS